MNVKLAEARKARQDGRERSTIGLRASTKRRLDRCRAPGQCYDGIIQQMVDFWEKNNEP